MGSRQELALILKDVMEDNATYFQPPEDVKLIYPCLIYTLQSLEHRTANDAKYNKYRRYTLLLISRDKDEPLVDKIEDLPFCSHQNHYVSDNLYHDAFTLYY